MDQDVYKWACWQSSSFFTKLVSK